MHVIQGRTSALAACVKVLGILKFSDTAKHQQMMLPAGYYRLGKPIVMHTTGSLT